MSGFLWFSLRGYLLPGQTVDLQPPLDDSFIVLNGGNSPFTNAHFRVRPQEFALDLVGINAVGNRAALFSDSRDLQSYVVYDSPIISPCDGRISAVVNDLPDLAPPARDTENPAGNHVLIECKGIEVLLAHMQQGSSVVTVDDPMTEVSSSTLVLVAEEDQNVGSSCPQFLLVIKNETVKSKQVTEQGV